jgi:hypothetical protein
LRLPHADGLELPPASLARRHSVPRLLRYLVGVVMLIVASTENGETPLEPTAALSNLGASLRVTTRADDGTGSFRRAVLSANADPSIGSIRFDRGLAPIALVADGRGDLTIRSVRS